jgi:hypothetical protein
MLSPKFQGLKWRTFRLLILVCTGLSGIAPIAHGIYMFGFPQMVLQSGLPYYLAEGGLFLLGAVVYAVSDFVKPYILPVYIDRRALTTCRPDFPNVSSPARLTFSDHRIKFFMSSLSALQLFIFWVSSLLSTIIMRTENVQLITAADV